MRRGEGRINRNAAGPTIALRRERRERGPCLATASTIPVLSWANRSTIVQRSLKIQRSPRCEIHEYEFRDREIFFLRSSAIFEEFFFPLESDRRDTRDGRNDGTEISRTNRVDRCFSWKII